MKWIGPNGILAHAAEIVYGYDTGVTLRQLFYRLVADQSLPNTQNYYKTLSARTAEGRRDGTFPDLLDRTSRIEEPITFTDPDDGLDWLRKLYRHDRQQGQPAHIWLGVEKVGMSAQLDSWFTDPLGIPHIALGGFASQTLCDQVRRRIEADDRPSVLVYVGDHDPTGEDIDRDFQHRVGFDKVMRIALNADQLDIYKIPKNVLDPEVEKKLKRDSRSAKFLERHGYLDQYEVDALDPNLLRRLYSEAINQFMDKSKFETVMSQEAQDRGVLNG